MRVYIGAGEAPTDREVLSSLLMLSAGILTKILPHRTIRTPNSTERSAAKNRPGIHITCGPAEAGPYEPSLFNASSIGGRGHGGRLDGCRRALSHLEPDVAANGDVL